MDIVTILHSVEPEPEGAASFVCSLAVISWHLLFKHQFNLAEGCALRMEQLGRLTGQDAWTRGWIEMAHAIGTHFQGDAWAALTHIKHAEASLAEAGDPLRRSVVRALQGLCLVLLGAHAEGQKLLEALLESGEAMPLVVANAKLFLAVAKVERGTPDEALGEATALASILEAAPDLGGAATPLLLLAKCQLRRGNLGAAEREVLTAIRFFSGRPKNRALALATLADIRLAQHRSAEALASVQEALAALEAVPPAYRAGAYLPVIHAEALEATGDHDGVRTAIAAGHAELLARADFALELSKPEPCGLPASRSRRS